MLGGRGGRRRGRGRGQMAVRCQAMKKMQRGNGKAGASGTCAAPSFILASPAGFLLPLRNKSRPFLAALGGAGGCGGHLKLSSG